MTGVKLTVTMKGTERNLCSGNSVIIFHILLFADAMSCILLCSHHTSQNHFQLVQLKTCISLLLQIK